MENRNLSQVDLVDWTHRFTLDCGLIQHLPLSGFRTFDQLALLFPGVSRVPFSPGQGPAVGVGVGKAGQFSVNGFRGRSNGFTVDGSDNNDEDIGMRRQGFIALVPQTVDSIQDFQIQTAGFPGEFGRNSASVVNVVSRSGTKDIHGTLYGAFSHDALNAHDFFQQELAGLFDGEDFSQQIYGGVLGGAISSNLYYFVSAEYQRVEGSRLGHFVAPSVDERGLRVSTEDQASRVVRSFDGFVPIEELGTFFATARPGLAGPFDPIPYGDQAGLAIFGLYPLPNNPLGPFGKYTYSQVAEESGQGTILSGKADWQVSHHHTATGRYNFTQDESIIPFTGDAISSSVATDTRTQNFSSYLNSYWERIANVLRFSYGRTRLEFPPQKGSPLLLGAIPCGGTGSCLETSFGRFGFDTVTGPVGQLTIVPYSTIGVDVFNFPQGRVDNTFQLADGLTWVLSDHMLQFGADIRFSQLNSFADRNSRPALLFGNGFVDAACRERPSCPFDTDDGLLRGTDLAALGAPAAVLHTLSTGPIPDTTIGLRIGQYDFYIHDNWRVRRNLSLNLSLRYEYHTPPSEVNRRIEDTFDLSPSEFGRLEDLSEGGVAGFPIQAWNEAFDNALLGLSGFLDGRQRIFDSDRSNFAPRIGLAWDPFGGGRASIRAGYGIFYDANLGAVASQSRNVFPTFVPANLDPNFNPPTGRFVNSPHFAIFRPAAVRSGGICEDFKDARDPPPECFLVQRGTLNTYNFSGNEFATGLGTLFTQTLDPNAPSSNGLAFTLPERTFKRPYGQHFALSAQQQFGNFVASLGYLGTRGVHLVRFNTPNAGWITTPSLDFTRDQPQEILIRSTPPATPPGRPPGQGRSQRDLGAFTAFSNSGSSTYHSMQAWLTKRLGTKFQFRINWTWSHAIDDVSDAFDGRGFFAFPQDDRFRNLERGPASFDVRHRISGYFYWNLPRWRLLRHWKLSGIAEVQTGQPFTVNMSWDRNGDGNLTDRLDSLQGLRLEPDSAAGIRLDPSFQPFVSTVSGQDEIEGLGTLGRMGRNSFRADGIVNLDLALSRTFELPDNKWLDFRVEVFNLFNHTSFGVPYRILDARLNREGNAESPGFGRSFDTQTDARSFRVWVRLDF